MAEVVCRGVRFHLQKLASPRLPEAARPVVFLHGLVMDNLSSWYFTVANAVAQRSPVLLYDLRGHGKSERPAQGYGLEDMVADLAAVLDGAGAPGPVVLVGNSFGGLLALSFARAHPERVAGMCLVDAHFGDEMFGAQMEATLRLTGEERDRRIADSFQSWLGRHSERKRTRLAQTAEALVYGTSLVADIARTPELTAEQVAQIRVPVLALFGERSDLRARVEIIPGCSHSILWEATELVRQRVLRFVEEVG